MTKYTNLTCVFMIVVVVQLFAFLIALSPACYAEFYEEKIVHLHGDQQILFYEVAQQISQQTGYKVFFDNNLKKETVFKISGDIPVDKLLKRLLRGKNYAVLFDEAKNNIIISSFGRKRQGNFVKVDSANKTVSINNSTLLKINNAIKKNQKRMAQQVKDEKSLDPVSGKSYVQIEESLKKIADRVKNPDAMDSVAGDLYSNINKVVKYNAMKMKNDPDSIDPITKKKYREINTRIDAHKPHEEDIDPVTGKSYEEINSIISRNSKHLRNIN